MPENSSETGRLLKGAAEGNKDSWGALLTRHEDRLRRLVAFRLDQRLQGRIDVADVIQEDYLEASSHQAEYLQKPSMPFFLWLRGITANKLLELAQMTEQDLLRPEGSQPAVSPSPPKRRFWSPEKIGAVVGTILVGSVGGTKFILNISADPVITVAMLLIYALIGAFVGGLVGKSMRGSSGKAKQDPPQPKTAQPAVSAPPPEPRSWTAETAGAIAGAVLVGGFMGVGLHLGGFALLLLALLGAFFGGAAGKLIMYLVGPR